MTIAYTRASSWPKLREGRFASCIQDHFADRCRLALLGLPDDTGVELNRGRPGARSGPGAFRQALASFGTRWDALTQSDLDVPIYDAGDVEPAPGDDEQALFETHRRVEAALLDLRQLGLMTVCVGGGHDLSLPALSAVSKHAGRALGGVNLDAHLDVREHVGSGMPFRRLIENGRLDPRHFVELGLGRFANDEGDLGWLQAKGARWVLASQVRQPEFSVEAELKRCLGTGAAFVSIDLDGLDQSIAPGVSAPNPLGLALAPALDLAEAAGKTPEVLHFDVMELNPKVDPEQRTARVAALLFLHFVAGFRQRKARA